MTANPIDLVLVDGVNVSKADVRSYEKTRVRMRMADANEVRNTQLSGQSAGIYVRSLQNNFDLDTTDTTTADDGVNCIHDFDGNRFKKVAIDTSRSQRKVTTAGDVTLAADCEDVIVIAKTVGEATKVIYPLANSRTEKVRTADGKYDAATNNITIRPKRPTTVTISIATPAVITWTGHGRSANSPVSLETSGALPTGLAQDTQYYVKTVLDANTFTVSAAPGGAAIDTSGSQSGTHKIGTDTIMGGASYIIDSNGSSIELEPLSDGTGWI